MTKIEAHADDYNIVCEDLHNDNDRLHAFIAQADAGMLKRGACSFPVFPSLEPPMLT